MREQFVEFLREPTLERFNGLRDIVLMTDGFDPYSTELDTVTAMMQAGDFEGVIRLINGCLWPSYFLSPSAHMNLAFAHHKTGDEQNAEMEHYIWSALLRGIELTGDGTAASPYIVLRTSDEYDMLEARELVFKGQALVSKDDRHFDVITVEDHDDVWFDITDAMRCLNSPLGGDDG
jgi:hypothetical protein